jgi:hypothetical protein
LDAWKGGAMLARKHMKGEELPEFTISKAQYEECGHNYLKEHFTSNYLYGAGKKEGSAYKRTKVI